MEKTIGYGLVALAVLALMVTAVAAAHIELSGLLVMAALLVTTQCLVIGLWMIKKAPMRRKIPRRKVGKGISKRWKRY